MVKKLLNLVAIALSWLPRSPFADFQPESFDSVALQWLNWLFPVHDCLILIASWVAAIAIYYLASVVLRWVKAIE